MTVNMGFINMSTPKIRTVFTISLDFKIPDYLLPAGEFNSPLGSCELFSRQPSSKNITNFNKKSWPKLLILARMNCKANNDQYSGVCFMKCDDILVTFLVINPKKNPNSKSQQK